MAKSGSEALSFAELERQALNFEREQDLERATAAFDAALRLNPSSRSCAEGRARIALQLGQEGAAEHCARALAFHDADPELQSQMIATAASVLGIAAIPLLESFLDRHPQDVGALELMANLQAEAGAGDGFADRHQIALSKHPEDKSVLLSYWGTLSRSGRHLQTLESMDANRSLFGRDRDFAMMEIAVAAHGGQVDRASRLLENQDDSPDVQLARGLNRLQRDQPEKAAEFLEAVVKVQPDNLEAWSFLELAWRILRDPRHVWLVDEPRLIGASQLDLDIAQLADIAATLRTMHRASAQPVGQSVRGGTQTPGQLFLRREREITLLTDALTASIREFVDRLPPADPRHPLLRYRNAAMAFGPSWSVRLTGGGHHAAHFHPGGILSSACYISVPEELAANPEQQGWLEIGRPPSELGLDLPPLVTVEPKPGRLVLFPSFLFHGTRPFAAGERLTVAFDLAPVPAN